jgi:photosystem II stability/assembly factor-like uncharacterized protein
MTRSMLCRRAPFAAAAVASLLLAASPEARAADVWQPLGPSGGTVAAVAIDPADSNTVYAGSIEAGVFKSTNGGRAWRPVGLDGGISQLAVAPGSRTVYAVTGFGLFRSRDGGASWTDLSAPLKAAGTPYVRSLALSPAPGTVYAVVQRDRYGTDHQKVLQSTDGGESWRPAWVPPSGVFVGGVFTDPSDPQAVFAGTSQGVYASADAGVTWTAGDLRMGIFTIAAEAGPRHRLMALVNSDRGHPEATLQVSSDRGKTWRPRGGPQSRPISFLRADPTTPGAFVTLGVSGDLYRTTDAGIHWTSLGLAPRRPLIFDLALDPHRAGVAFLAAVGERFGRGLWKTASFGAAWTPFFRGLEAGDFVTLTPDPARPETLWAGTRPGGATSITGLWTSLDRGLTWTQTAFPADGVPAIVPTSRSLFAAVAGQGLFRSDDSGLRWTRTTLGETNVYVLLATPQEPGTLYALGPELSVSLDNGATWTRLGEGLPRARTHLSLDPTSPSTVYAATEGGGIYRLERTKP